MLYELQDGHVNLASAHNVSYYDAWYQDYPRNFRADLLEDSYLGRASTDYRTAAGLKYKILKDNIGYIRYESFADPVGNGNLDEVLSYLSVCNGLIIDVRDNGGGNATNSARIASRFTNEKILTGYISHKTGTGHNDFSKPYAIYLEPANGVRWQKKVVVLTNRRSFSATNDFVNHMRCLPNVTTIGDKTGGGSGMPFTSELPNGWSVRFSASPHFDAEMNHSGIGNATRGSDGLITAAAATEGKCQPPVRLTDKPLRIASKKACPSPTNSLRRSFSIRSRLNSVSFTDLTGLARLTMALRQSKENFRFSAPPNLKAASAAFR